MAKEMNTQYFVLGIGLYVFLLDSVTSIKITVMAPEHPKERMFSLTRIKPAIEIASEKIQNMGILAEDFINITYIDTEESEITTPVKAFEIIKDGGQNVFLGPVGDYVLSPVAQYAPYWNVPIVSPGGLSHTFNEKRHQEYRTLTRIGAGFESVVRFVEDYIIKTYKWKKIATIYDTQNHGLFHGYGYLLGSAVSALLDLTNYETEYVLIPSTLLGSKEVNQQALENFYEKNLKEKVGNKFGGMC